MLLLLFFPSSGLLLGYAFGWMIGCTHDCGGIWLRKTWYMISSLVRLRVTTVPAKAHVLLTTCCPNRTWIRDIYDCKLSPIMPWEQPHEQANKHAISTPMDLSVTFICYISNRNWSSYSSRFHRDVLKNKKSWLDGYSQDEINSFVKGRSQFNLSLHSPLLKKAGTSAFADHHFIFFSVPIKPGFKCIVRS